LPPRGKNGQEHPASSRPHVEICHQAITGAVRSPLRQSIGRLLAARTLPLDHAAARIAGEVYVRLRGLGLEIGVNDSLLAGMCLRFDLLPATRNTRHFARVEGLRLVE
jgi:predicted nucleic acid-binding protein